MTKFFRSIRVPALAATLTLILAAGSAFAQSTTSSLRVVVTDENGAAVAGAPVSVRHIPTGRTQVANTNSAGVVNLRGMAVGGPYEVGLDDGASYNAATVQNVYLELDETSVIPLAARSGSIEEIVVMARQVAENVGIGVGNDFS
ncbi:MAG: carboxypeptidase-like regulatory domain-containing protein, partial [Pseudomonadota bacterium]